MSVRFWLKGCVEMRFDEILETINSTDSLLEEFDEEIFNALVEKKEMVCYPQTGQ